MLPSNKSIVSGTAWGILAKILDALAKFVTIPLLAGYYGKEDYGLIALAFSLNTYLRLMDMGMNIGSIRFFSIWISEKKWEKISKVSRSSIVFYGAIGVINALVFVYMAYNATNFFILAPQQVKIFNWIMYILAASTMFNWVSNVVTQLLTATGEITWINQVTVISSLLNFITAFVAVKLEISLPIYFIIYTLTTLIVIPLNLLRLKVYNMPIWDLVAPRWDGSAFREILNYSLAIFVMGIFQFSADNLRPLLLGRFASKGIEVLTEYRVIQTLTMLVIAFGGVFTQVLLPSATRLVTENNTDKIKQLVFSGTKYISIFLSFIVFMLILISEDLLTLYMGEDYRNLSLWLNIWLLTALIAMHNAPVASLVLSSGKTKPLIYSSGIACFLSLPVTAMLASKLNVGAAVIGYLLYVFIQITFYYVYYIPKVLNLGSLNLLLNSFAPSLLVGTMSAVGAATATNFVNLSEHSWQSLITNSLLYTIIYVSLVISFVLKPKQIKEIKILLRPKA